MVGFGDGFDLIRADISRDVTRPRDVQRPSRRQFGCGSDAMESEVELLFLKLSTSVVVAVIAVEPLLSDFHRVSHVLIAQKDVNDIAVIPQYRFHSLS